MRDSPFKLCAISVYRFNSCVSAIATDYVATAAPVCEKSSHTYSRGWRAPMGASLGNVVAEWDPCTVNIDIGSLGVSQLTFWCFSVLFCTHLNFQFVSLFAFVTNFDFQFALAWRHRRSGTSPRWSFKFWFCFSMTPSAKRYVPPMCVQYHEPNFDYPLRTSCLLLFCVCHV